MNKQNKQTYKTIEGALEFVKTNCKAKFDSTVELHINTNLDVTKSDQMLRVSIVLPKGTGKTKRVAVLGAQTVKNADFEITQDYLDNVKKGKIDPKKDFDVLIAQPSFMAKLASAAQVLGPAGLMPSPKSGTVTEDMEKAVEQVKRGKVEIKTETAAPVIHTILGKKSFPTADLAENFNEIWSAIVAAKPQKAKPGWIKSVYICTSMSPSARLQV